MAHAFVESLEQVPPLLDEIEQSVLETESLKAKSQTSSKRQNSNPETEIQEIEVPQKTKFDNTNTLNPVKKKEMMKRIAAPLQLEEINEFEEMELRDTYTELDFKAGAPNRDV